MCRGELRGHAGPGRSIRPARAKFVTRTETVFTAYCQVHLLEGRPARAGSTGSATVSSARALPDQDEAQSRVARRLSLRWPSCAVALCRRRVVAALFDKATNSSTASVGGKTEATTPISKSPLRGLPIGNRGRNSIQCSSESVGSMARATIVGGGTILLPLSENGAIRERDDVAKRSGFCPLGPRIDRQHTLVLVDAQNPHRSFKLSSLAS